MDSVIFVIVLVLGGFFIGMFFTIAIIDFQLKRGRLPRSLLKHKDKIVALIEAKEKGGDAHPQALGSGPSKR